MKKVTLTFLALFLTASFLPVQAQSPDAHDQLKKHINSIVEDVEQAESADEKREILNQSFDKLISAFEEVQSMDRVPESDKRAIAGFKKSILEKKNELNGTDGYNRVPDTKLNDFSNYVQQDLEQADRAITISLTTALLIIIILLLL